jgi:hypothetical protein
VTFELTDRQGRTPAERVATVHRYGGPVTDDQRAAATALLTDMLEAAARHGVTIADFDYAVDLPGGCLDVILAKARR